MRNQPWYFDGIRVAAHLFLFSVVSFVLFVFVLCLIAMLPVSLGCPFVIAPSVFSYVYIWIGSKIFKRGG
jgi:hypothetical protein